MASGPNDREELVAPSETTEQLINQCSEFFDEEKEEPVEELVEPNETVEQLLNQYTEYE